MRHPLRLSLSLILLVLALPACLDAQETLEALVQAAEQGDPESQYDLGEAHRRGDGVPQDFAEAARWYRMAAEQGHRLAQSSLGLAYRNGEGVLKDDFEAARWFQLAAEQTVTFRFVSLHAAMEEDPAEAVRVFQMEAESGHARSQFRLGVAYMSGEDVPQDLAEAAHWFQVAAQNYPIAGDLARNLEAAERGDPAALAQAQFSLGWAYEEHLIDVFGDLAEAVRWYRMAAEQGHVAAQFSLGVAYMDGEAGVLKDPPEAVRWYRMAAEQGHYGAKFTLGGLVREWRGRSPRHRPRAYVAQHRRSECLASNPRFESSRGRGDSGRT